MRAGKGAVQKSLNARVHGRKPVPEKFVLLLEIAQQRAGQLEEVRFRSVARRPLSEGGHFQSNVSL
jgi:hypothetical protein